MISHQMSIVLDKQSIEANRSSNYSEYHTNTQVSARWQITLSGEIEFDDPRKAVSLLEELQDQIEKIRLAYR